MRTRIVKAIVGTILLMATMTANPQQSSAGTSCGAAIDAATLGTTIIYRMATGDDPCSTTVVGTGPAPAAPTLTCTPPRMLALPDFKSRGRGTATYRFGGTCTNAQGGGGTMTYEIGGQWTPGAQKGPNASELIKLTGYESLFPDFMAGGQIYILKYARCTRDPWINSPACTNYGTTIPDPLRESWSKVDGLASFPWTTNVLSKSDKSQLIAQYNQINGIVHGLKTSPVGAATQSAAAAALNARKNPSQQSLSSARQQISSGVAGSGAAQQLSKSANIVSQCGPGLVRRQVGPNDYKCVTPESR